MVVTAMMASPAFSQKDAGWYFTGAYEVDTHWPQNPCGAGYQIGSSVGIFAESPDLIFVFARGCLPVNDDNWGSPVAIVPSRDAAPYSLQRDDPARHPKWTYVLYILDSEGRLVDNWDQHNHMFVRPQRIEQRRFALRECLVGDRPGHQQAGQSKHRCTPPPGGWRGGYRGVCQLGPDDWSIQLSSAGVALES